MSAHEPVAEVLVIKECNQCGKCCIKYANGGLSASAEEIDWWQTYRPDIARYVGFEGGLPGNPRSGTAGRSAKIWCDPDTGSVLLRCPWLVESPTTEAYSCSIYYDRPEDCRHYPVDITQMVIDDCEMLEPHDLKDTHKAQRSLDRIMLTSRPSGA